MFLAAMAFGKEVLENELAKLFTPKFFIHSNNKQIQSRRSLGQRKFSAEQHFAQRLSRKR